MIKQKAIGLRHSIDEIKISMNKCFIRGWAFSDISNNISIKLFGAQYYDITYMDRQDVKDYFNEENTPIKCGFLITCKCSILTNKLKLVFEDGESKVIKVIRLIRIRFKQLKNTFSIALIKKSIYIMRKQGFKSFIKKVKNKLFNIQNNRPYIDYQEWFNNYLPTKSQLLLQTKEHFINNPLISLVVPVYNTQKAFLTEMFESVLNQTYSNWELCIADGASTHLDTIYTLKSYMLKDKRIKIKFLDKNLMISGNTNEALSLVSGEYIGLLDHDDLLTPNCLFEVVKAVNINDYPDLIYSDEDKIDEKSTYLFDPHFKPDWSPDTFRSYNYISHFTVFKTLYLKLVGKFNSEYDGSQDYDMYLRIIEKAKKIYHIPKVLYHWRAHSNSTAYSASSKSYATIAAQKALSEHLKRLNLKGVVKDGLFITSYKIDYDLYDHPLISIIVPNKDHKADLEKCISSIVNKSTYNNYEIIIIENNSTSQEIFDYYKKLQEQNKNIQVIVWDKEFNYSAINNFAIKSAKGDYLILLNNDTEIITNNWIEELLMYAQRKEVGIVGAKLYYPDNTVQHAGVILGIGGVAGHSHKYYSRDSLGFMGRLCVVQNISAVTAACLMVKRKIFEEVNGFDESFAVAFNDIDFCIKVIRMGYLNIFNPYVELYHFESKSRGLENTLEKKIRFKNEINRFEKKWGLWVCDPYYNENLTKYYEDFSLR